MFPGRYGEIPFVCLFVTISSVSGVSGASKINFIGIIYFCKGRDRLSTRSPDHGAVMVFPARMTQLRVGKSSWVPGGRVCRVGWSLYKINVRTTSLVAN